MTTWFGLKGVSVVVALGSALALSSACSSGGSGGNGGSGGSGTGASGSGTMLPAGTGICEASCPKDCTSDNDCQTSQGELCCDIGVGKICADAQECPRFCTDDSKCDTANGEACLQVSQQVTQKVCTQPANALQVCQQDSQCTGGDVCCGNYAQSVCMPPSECPKSCTASTQCNTGSGEVCCTTVQKVDSSLTVSGLCLNPTYEPCPQACTQSSDCTGTSGSLCCDGVCSTTCDKQCQMSSDCTDDNARLCCKSAIVRLPAAGHVFTTGPTCSGTPIYTNCAECSELNCCSVVPGCVTGAGTGICTGDTLPCFDNFSELECTDDTGCLWDSVNLECTGTATDPCAVLTTSTACNTNLDCFWESTGVSTCTGTPTYSSCAGLSATLCGTVLGCSLSTTPLPGTN